MPCTERKRSPAVDSWMTRRIGIPPATLASKPIGRLCDAARRNSSSPCSASKFLLAVTTGLPCSSEERRSSSDSPVPPIVSTTTSTLGSFSKRRQSATAHAPAGVSWGCTLERRHTAVTTRRTPLRCAIRSACLTMISAVARPTVPNPTMPTRTCFMVMKIIPIRQGLDTSSPPRRPEIPDVPRAPRHRPASS